MKSVPRLLITVVVMSACAGPQTQLGTVSRDQVVIEQARQQQFALELAIKQQSRLHNVTQPLLQAAAPMCGKKIKPSAGFLALNANAWKKDYYAAARAAGFGDTLTLVNVVPGMPAAYAGLRVGDRVLAVNTRQLLTGAKALSDFDAAFTAATRASSNVSIHFRRGSDTSTADLRLSTSCSYTTHLVEGDEINAYADGKAIYITQGIMRFFPDDEDLAVLVGHEIAHDAMGHIDSKMTNSLVGALLGAVVDVAAATQGINTQGDFTNQGARLGAMVFSQDFEREADYVGLYIIARSGRPLETSAQVWRQLGAAKPGQIKFASSHPTSAERFVRLDTWRREIHQKVASGAAVLPDMKNATAARAMELAAARLNGAGAAPTSVAASNKVSEPPPSVGGAVAAVRSTTPGIRAVVNEGSALADRRAGNSTAIPNSAESSKKVVSTVREREAGRTAEAVIGAPSSELARAEAIDTFAEGQRHLANHNWLKAEASFRKTLQFDGSIAKYHAALGSVLMVLHKWEDAEAEYTAAVLLDVDNAEYRKMVKRARSSRR